VYHSIFFSERQQEISRQSSVFPVPVFRAAPCALAAGDAAGDDSYAQGVHITIRIFA
jgi:hypothetical protein